MKMWANILLGAWLILSGLLFLGGIRFSGSGTILAVLGIATGVLFLIIDRSDAIMPRLGNVLLGIWLIAGGLFPLLHVRFHGRGIVLAVLGVAAGVVLLIRR